MNGFWSLLWAGGLVACLAAPLWGQFEPQAIVTEEKPGAPRRDATKPAATQPDVYGKEAIHHWKAGMTIRAGATPCGGILGTVPVPLDWPEQTVRLVKEDVPPQVRDVKYRTLDDGAKQMVVTIPLLNPGQTATVAATFEVTRRAILPPSDPSQFVMPTKMSRDVRRFLGSSPYIETRHPQIRAKAKEVTEGKDQAWEKAEAIYDWVREHVEYRDGELKGALAALRDGHGDCEELTSLFIALCRVSGIPARTVRVPGHCYPEFYLEDQEGQGRWFPCQAAGTRDFGGMAEYRPILQKGDNFRVPEQKEPQRYVVEFLKIKAIRGGGPPHHEFIAEQLPAN